jgi:hypothetical protein
MPRTPRAQAHAFLRVLTRKLEDSYKGPLPPILVATAFPQTPFQAPPSHGDLTNGVLGQQDLPWLGTALETLVDRQLGASAPVKDQGWSSALHRLWGETWVPRVSLGARIELRGHQLVPLDADQLRLLAMLDHSARLHVSGGPGTGKTLLSRALCERRAPALYLCWTRALAAAVRASGIADAWTVREYAAHLLARAGVPVADGAPRAAWAQDVWESIALHAAVDGVPAERAHRIVVVDEAQDFAESEWELVKALAGDGALWAFGDAGQSFWAERSVPKGLFGAELALTARYRSPEGLATFAELYRSAPAPGAERKSINATTPPSAAKAEVASAPRPPRCAELRVIAVQGDTAAVLGRIRVELVRALKDGAKPGDIAILSLVGQSKSQLVKEPHVADTRLVRADAPDAADHVVADTFLRFKGLERPYVIVTELSAGPERYDVRMHVALTRATLACVVVGTEEEIARDPRLATQSGAR